jgi:two-component system phosphate regulon sensor histidine kinase PhoR
MLGRLGFRTAIAYVLLIVAGFAGLGLYVLNEVENDLRESIESDLASQSQMVKSIVQPMMAEGAPAAALNALAAELGAGGDTRVTFIAPDGTVLGDSLAEPTTVESQLSLPEIREAITFGQGTDTRHSAALDEEVTYAATRVTEGDSIVGIVRVGRPTAAIGASLTDITRSVLIAVGATAAAGGLISIVLSGTIVSPLRRLRRVARSIAAGNLGERVSPRPSGEVGELADAFNEMARGVEELVTAASHERTRLAAVLDSASDAVIAVDGAGRVTLANAAAQRLLVPTQDELIGRPFTWALPDEQVVEALRASREEGRQETRLIERPGRQYLQVITTPIRGGGEWAAVVVFHDLTDVKRAEQVRRDFVANVSHELRSPLAGIKSVLDTLQGGALEDKKAAREFLSRADAEVDRLVQLVEELLELSRIESGAVPLAREPVEMGQVLAEAVDRMRRQAERKQLTLTLDVADNLSPVIGDADRLERATVNLIHNALKFTPSGGSVHVHVASEDGAVKVRVSDTGVGIAAEDLPRVFERFYKADRARRGGGTGLGLAVVKHTVEAHGGTVAVESEPGRGSTFTFSIPTGPVPLPR